MERNGYMLKPVLKLSAPPALPDQPNHPPYCDSSIAHPHNLNSIDALGKPLPSPTTTPLSPLNLAAPPLNLAAGLKNADAGGEKGGGSIHHFWD